MKKCPARGARERNSFWNALVGSPATATLRGQRLIRVTTDFHSHSYELVRGYLRRFSGLLPGGRFLGSKMDIESPESRKGIHFDPPGPPNLQLNLSSDHFENTWMRKRHELFLAAVAAVILQLGLLAIAAITVFHEETRNATDFEPKEHGFPAYLIGSLLLAFGMGLCSLAIEQSTTEKKWRVPESSDGRATAAGDKLLIYPRLIWLQQGQTVSDQSFKPFAILAGPKRYVMTSSRKEDVRDKIAGPGKGSPRSSMESIPDSRTSENPNKSVTWELLTLVGVFSAASGFIAQFIGLRGLAYPCSIAQLAAIFLMALVRALIRRRLGRIPGHSLALAGYELDFLATHITFCPEFRNFHYISPENQQYIQEATPPKLSYRWRVKTPRPGQTAPFLFRLPKEIDAALASMNPDGSDQDKTLSGVLIGEKGVSSNSIDTKTPRYFEEASSQQLLRVRKRLGDLSNWISNASSSALALARSVEHFLNSFFGENPAGRRFDRLEWLVEAAKPVSTTSGEAIDTFTISAKRSQSDPKQWEVDLGKIEAVLSLWMATVEAQHADESELPKTAGRHPKHDWRRADSGKGMKYKFCRILGDDFRDGILKRDISWWVDEILAERTQRFRTRPCHAASWFS